MPAWVSADTGDPKVSLLPTMSGGGRSKAGVGGPWEGHLQGAALGRPEGLAVMASDSEPRAVHPGTSRRQDGHGLAG